MVTLGVDLAAQAPRTGLCSVRWRGRTATVELARRRAGDETILGAAHDADAVGVDAPFGWPIAFTEAVTKWDRIEPWPYERPADRATRVSVSERLRLRATDHFVIATTRERARARYPLSVSTDKIGIPAMRAVALLTSAGAPSRVDGPWFEVYPAAARALWKLPPENDKRDRAARELRLDRLEAHVRDAGAELRFAPGTRGACLASDDVLDALLCAFVARAAALGATFPPPDAAHAEAAKREGWIHMPCGGLADLFTERQSGRYVRSGG